MKGIKKQVALFLCALSMTLLFIFPNLGEAKEIQLQGTSASDAIVTDKDGNIVTGNPDLSQWHNYNIHYDWSLPSGEAIHNGDTATFEIPDNVIVPSNLSFPVKDMQGHTVGTFTISKGAHTGTLTFNDHYEQYPQENIHGMIDFSVTGTEDSGGTDWNPIVKSGWTDDETNIPTWNISYNHKSQHLTNVVITDTLHGDQQYYGDIIVQYGHYEGENFIVEREETNPSYVTIDGKTMTANIGDIQQAVQIRYQTMPTNYQEGDHLYLENVAHGSSNELGDSEDMASIDLWGDGSADGTNHPKPTESESQPVTPPVTNTNVTESTDSQATSSGESTDQTMSSEDTTNSTKPEVPGIPEQTTSISTTESTESQTTSSGESTDQTMSSEDTTNSTKPEVPGMPEQTTNSSSMTPSTPDSTSSVVTVNEDNQLTQALNQREPKRLPQTGNKTQSTLSICGLIIVALSLIYIVYTNKKQRQ